MKIGKLLIIDMSFKFDDLLEEMGGFGKFQKRLVYGFFSWVSILIPFVTGVGVYLVFTPDHWCNIQGREKYGVSLDEWKNLTIPWETGPDGLPRLSQCKIYEWSKNLSQANISLPQLRQMAERTTSYKETIDCPDAFGWTFDESVVSHNQIADFQWVCHRSEILPLSMVLGGSSGAIGFAITTPLADRFGRRRIFYVSLLANTLGAIFVMAYVTTSTQYIWSSFVNGILFPEPFQLLFVLVMEYIIPSKRNYVNFISRTWWSIGSAIVPLIGWLTKGNWRYVVIYLGAMHSTLYLFYWCFKESPRWLILRGRTEEALALMKTISKVNGVSEPEHLDLKMQLIKTQENTNDEDSVSYGEILKWKKIVVRIILLIIVWTACGAVYGGVRLNVINLAGNPYLNSFVMALVEFPSFALCWLLLDRIGRRWTSFFGLFVSSVSLFLCMAVPPEINWLVVLLSTVARSGGTLMQMVIFMYSAELAPTSMRSFGVAFPNGVSGLLMLTQPYVITEGRNNKNFPFLVMGVLSAIGGVVALFLPETANQNLPQTLEEANDFGRNQKFFSFNLNPTKEDPPAPRKEGYEKIYGK